MFILLEFGIFLLEFVFDNQLLISTRRYTIIKACAYWDLEFSLLEFVFFGNQLLQQELGFCGDAPLEFCFSWRHSLNKAIAYYWQTFSLAHVSDAQNTRRQTHSQAFLSSLKKSLLSSSFLFPFLLCASSFTSCLSGSKNNSFELQIILI